MRFHHALLCAAAIGLLSATAGPAFAAPAPTLWDASKDALRQAYPGEAYSQHRRAHGAARGGGGMRHGGGPGMRPGAGMRHGGHVHRGGGYRGGRGIGAAAAGIGLAAGLIGAAIAAQQPPPPPVYGGGDPRWNRYCFRTYGPSFDPGSGTYLAADGLRYPCQ